MRRPPLYKLEKEGIDITSADITITIKAGSTVMCEDPNTEKFKEVRSPTFHEMDTIKIGGVVWWVDSVTLPATNSKGRVVRVNARFIKSVDEDHYFLIKDGEELLARPNYDSSRYYKYKRQGGDVVLEATCLLLSNKNQRIAFGGAFFDISEELSCKKAKRWEI